MVPKEGLEPSQALPTAPSTLRVYQFHHFGIFVIYPGEDTGLFPGLFPAFLRRSARCLALPGCSVFARGSRRIKHYRFLLT